MPHVWDYNLNELKKSTQGRLLILERQINYGIYLSDKEKISLKDVKRNWHKLNIDPQRRRFFELLIWGK
jgi:hypothetical protein